MPDEPQEPEGAATEPEGAEALGDPGKQALDRMKAERNTERSKRKELEGFFTEVGMTPEEIRAALDKVSSTPDLDKVRREARAEAQAKFTEGLVRAEVRAAAKAVLNDPADAFRYLDLKAFDVDDDGNVDEEQVAKAIGDLVKAKPYLAADSSRFEGKADQGARNGATPQDMNALIRQAAGLA